jgi:hypothetical protein
MLAMLALNRGSVKPASALTAVNPNKCRWVYHVRMRELELCAQAKIWLNF